VEHIKETQNEHHWPRCKSKTVECRKRDLVIRITDWSDDKYEPAFDVECYIGGVYDGNESKCFTRWEAQKAKPLRPNGRPWKANAKAQAVAFANAQIAKLL
jgi:hypothetical protein